LLCSNKKLIVGLQVLLYKIVSNGSVLASSGKIVVATNWFLAGGWFHVLTPFGSGATLHTSAWFAGPLAIWLGCWKGG